MFFNWFKRETKCPNCYLQWSSDGHKCIHCGYIKKLARKKKELLTQIMNLFDPKIFNPSELYHKKELIPESPGVYAWYFDNHFGTYFTAPTAEAIKIALSSAPTQDWFLLYIGIAGKKRERTLRDRIYRDHLNQNSKGSTLRQSLASLLWQEINLNPVMQLNGENEKQKLNRWIFQHARVAWIENGNPRKVEKVMISEFGKYLLLNLQDNKSNPYRKELQRLRKSWKKSGK